MMSKWLKDELLQPLFIGEEEEEDDEKAKPIIDPNLDSECFVILTSCEDLIRKYVPTYRSNEHPGKMSHLSGKPDFFQ